MTIAILSEVRRSTSGLAPVFRATMRFWIKVDSLNRPPTLLTIASSFRSSSMLSPHPLSLELTFDDRAQLGDRLLEIVVDHLLIVLGGAGQFLLGGRQPPLNRRLVLRAALAQSFLVGRQGGGPQEHRHATGALTTNL